jgi:hypothetical protein
MNRIQVASARQIFVDTRFSTTKDIVRLEKSFFKSICLPNGTHKTTAPARLCDVDLITATYLRGKNAVSLLDVAISSGVTTLELLDLLESRGFETSGIGVDICVRAILRSILGIDVLYDAEGNVLQVATPFFARGRPHHSQTSIRSRALRLAIKLLESQVVLGWMRKSPRSHQLDLVSPRLLARSRFEIVEHDIGIPHAAWDRSFDMVRAANILNSDYFSPDQINVMATNLRAWLKVGGLLVVCSTSAVDGCNHGMLYRKLDMVGNLEPLHQFGCGVEHDCCIRRHEVSLARV